jgi:hypothetical protein
MSTEETRDIFEEFLLAWREEMWRIDSSEEAQIMTRRDGSPERSADRRSGRGLIGGAAAPLP